LNGFQGLFVASNSRLAEGPKGWQAFFSLFLKVFLNPKQSVFGTEDHPLRGAPRRAQPERRAMRYRPGTTRMSQETNAELRMSNIQEI
jgi:hypothetical protein